MACKVKVNRHGFLAFHLFWNGQRSWEGCGLRDTAKNRRRVEARAVLISEEIENGIFDYLKRFPEGNKAVRFKPKEDLTTVKEEPKPKTVGEYYQEWIVRKKPPFVRKSLERDYRQHFGGTDPISGYILPRFADTLLSDITLPALDDFREFLNKDCDLSLKTCRNVIDGSLRALMRDARKERKKTGVADDDPFKDLEWPKIVKPKPDPFTEEERDEIIAYFKEKYPIFYPFVYTQFWTGMRPSEATALKWGYVDLKQAVADIQWSRHLGEENPPKTSGSERTIHLLPTVVDLLRNLYPLQATEGDYVFTNYEGGPIDAGEWARYYWKRMLRAKEIRPRKFYATRHTYISVALMAGVNIKWLAEACGTSVAMIERHYGRYTKDDGDAPLRALQEAKSETFSETFLGRKANYLKSVVVPTGIEPVLPT